LEFTLMPNAAPAARRIFITVAEHSGDLHAAQLITSLRQLDPDLIIEGFGGPEMRAAGATIHVETVRSAAMGFAALRRGPEVLRLILFARKYFRIHTPDLQICCDSWGLNSSFAKLAHRMGIPVLYYIAPQVWASREGRVKKLRKWVDQLACILPFEQDYFRRRGIKATFVGHPLFDELPPRDPKPPRDNFAEKPPTIGLLPGSRRGEAQFNFARMLSVAEQVRAAFPGTRFLVPTTPATDPIVRAAINGSPDIERRENAFDEIIPQCDLCVTVSGTATLHVAGHHVPMIVVYSASEILWNLIGRWVVRTRTFALVNLLAGGDQHIVPEFVPWFGSPRAVGDLVIEYLRKPEKLTSQVDQLATLIKTLDHPGASRNVAKLALEMIREKSLAS
jgi:lipid-A-disaccharide synthase